MLKLMIGVKGTGKTKALIEKANTASRESHGDVVCVEKGTVLRFDLAPKIRLIDTDEYKIHNAQALYGFIAGILASNYDVTDLFLDNTLKICGGGEEDLEKLADALAVLTADREINIFMTASLPAEEASENLKKYL